MEHLSSMELLTLLKARQETRRREVQAVDENEGQQLITDFFQHKSNGQDKPLQEKNTPEKITWQSKWRAKHPDEESNFTTLTLGPVKSPEKPPRKRPLKLRLKLKTPDKSARQVNNSSLESSPVKPFAEKRRLPPVPAFDQRCQDKENCDPLEDNPVAAKRKNSVLEEVISIVEKVKREAREAKENAAQCAREMEQRRVRANQKRSFECVENDQKSRCVALDSSRPVKAQRKGLRA
jgi:hypothetical protein